PGSPVRGFRTRIRPGGGARGLPRKNGEHKSSVRRPFPSQPIRPALPDRAAAGHDDSLCPGGPAGYLEGMNRTTLDRLVEPLVRTLTPDVARSLIRLRADPELQARMDELAEKCNEGRLTAEEREEYETSIR